MATLNIGDMIPEFGSLPAVNLPAEVINREYLITSGKKHVIYFYPKDNTPGCTKESLEFQEHLEEFKLLNTEVIGVSKDSISSHDKFCAQHNLSFPLISDQDLVMLKAFGAWQEKSMYGKTFLGIQRSTYLIDEIGKIIMIWPKVKFTGHAKDVLRHLSA